MEKQLLKTVGKLLVTHDATLRDVDAWSQEVMLIPAGTQTLAYRIFDAQTEASLPDVGLAGLLLILLVLGVQLVVGRIRYEV